MSTHYLLDQNTNPITSSEINEARYNVTSTQMGGSFLVRISDNIPLSSEPDSFTALINGKYAAILAFYAGFTTILYDDMLLSPGVNSGASTGVYVGDRGSTKVLPSGVLTTTMVAAGATPTQCIVTWEAHHISNTDPESGRLTRVLNEDAPSDFTVQVSFDNGAHFNAVTDGGLFNIPAIAQGNQLILAFTNASGSNKWLGSWAVIF